MNKTMTLKNSRGEQITLTLSIEGRRIGLPGTNRCHEISISVVESSVPVELSAGVRAITGSGLPINHWQADGQRIICTRGDIKRLGTYPIFVFVGGDRTKKGRFMIHHIDGLERDRLHRLSSN